MKNFSFKLAISAIWNMIISLLPALSALATVELGIWLGQYLPISYILVAFGLVLVFAIFIAGGMGVGK